MPLKKLNYLDWITYQQSAFSSGISPELSDRVESQGLSQDLETGCPKLPIVKFLGVQNVKGDHNILRFQPYTYIKFIKIRHDILIRSHGNHMEMTKINYML